MNKAGILRRKGSGFFFFRRRTHGYFPSLPARRSVEIVSRILA